MPTLQRLRWLRKRAAQLRHNAEQVGDELSKASILRVAQNYEEQADEFEAQLKPPQAK